MLWTFRGIRLWYRLKVKINQLLMQYVGSDICPIHLGLNMSIPGANNLKLDLKLLQTIVIRTCYLYHGILVPCDDTRKKKHYKLTLSAELYVKK